MADAKVVFERARSNGAQEQLLDRLKELIGANIHNSNTSQLFIKELGLLKKLYGQKSLNKFLRRRQNWKKKYEKSYSFDLMGASAAQIGRLNDAVLIFQKAITIKPDYAEAYYNMGNALKDQGKLVEAIKAYKKAISIKPDFAENYYNMGIALKEQGKLAEAIEAYKKAISIKPKYLKALNNMGVALKEQGKITEAIEVYKKSLVLNPIFLRSGVMAQKHWKTSNKLEELEIWLENASSSLEIVPRFKIYEI